jgi:hypothetical protein
MIRRISKVGAELCEQFPFFSGESFRAQYCAFSRLIAQPF